MFRVPLRFLSSLFFFFNIISTLQDQNQVVVFSSSYLLQTPSSHWWVSHQSNNQSNVSERKQWEPFMLLHFTAAPLLQWSTQLSAPTPPLWSTLLFSQWWLTHTECFFFFFPARFFIFIPDVETRSPQGGKRRFSLSRLSPDGGLWKHWRVCRMYLEGCELFSSFVPFSSL